jgi:hypothetical protein
LSLFPIALLHGAIIPLHRPEEPPNLIWLDLDPHGSEAAVKKVGLMKLVGRDYVVQDGDVLYIRFNV